MSPLAGRLAQMFSPRNCIFMATLIFSLGAFITSRASDLSHFLLGRAVTGVGAAGIFTLSIILVIELTSKRRRGLFIGLLNAGFTTGVSLGAVIGGALLAPLGWVKSVLYRTLNYADPHQRALFWMQTPLALVAGLCLFFSIPKTFTAGTVSLDKQSLGQKLARVDYAGAILLVKLAAHLRPSSQS